MGNVNTSTALWNGGAGTERMVGGGEASCCVIFGMILLSQPL